MKKSSAFIVLFLCALLAWQVFAYSGDMVFDVDGERIDGPLGALAGMAFAGGGAVLAGVIMLLVGVLLALVFASVGIVLVGALGLGAAALALAISPLLLPLLLPLALIAYLASRSRKQRQTAEQAL